MAEAAAHAAAIAQAIKASGVLVRVEPMEFLKILKRQDEPLHLAGRAQVVTADSISIPG
jgi:hypothetical protein